MKVHITNAGYWFNGLNIEVQELKAPLTWYNQCL